MLCSQCGAPVGREEVGARVILVRVGSATLKCILRSAQLMDRRALGFSIEDDGCVSGGELATSGWADLKRADCRPTARLIIEVALKLGLGVAGGRN